MYKSMLCTRGDIEQEGTALLLCTCTGLWQGSPQPLWSWWLARRTHRTHHALILMTRIYYRQRTQAKPVKEKGTGDEVRKKPGASCQESSPSLFRMCLIPPVVTCAFVCEMSSSWEASLETEFLWGVRHMGILRLALPKFQTPGGKAGVQHKPYGLHKQFRHGEPLVAIREWWEPSQNPSRQTPAKGQSCKQASPRIAASGPPCSPFLHVDIIQINCQ